MKLLDYYHLLLAISAGCTGPDHARAQAPLRPDESTQFLLFMLSEMPFRFWATTLFETLFSPCLLTSILFILLREMTEVRAFALDLRPMNCMMSDDDELQRASNSASNGLVL
jgi:hypothetical protein